MSSTSVRAYIVPPIRRFRPLYPIGGFLRENQDLVPTIVVTKNEHWSAQIFTLFHELAHILRRTSAICLKEESTSDLGRVEAWCNSLAAASLVPEWDLKIQANERGLNGRQRNWALEELQELARYFRVSRHVIAIRLQEVGLAPQGYYNSVKPSLVIDDIPLPPRQAREDQEYRRNIPQERLAQIGGRAAQAILNACKEAILSTSEASDLLRMRPHSFGRFEMLAHEQLSRYG